MEEILRLVLICAPIMIIPYFLIVFPQKRQDKKHRLMLDELKKGDKIITVGGIHGKVVSVKEDRVVINVNGEGMQLTMDKRAIGRVLNKENKDQKIKDKK